MKIEKGRRAQLIIAGVFDGEAGVAGNLLSFAPNQAGQRADLARGGLLDGTPVALRITKDEAGPFWTAQFRPLA